jgi:Na+/proline symporter/signal transduction histidine kinase
LLFYIAFLAEKNATKKWLNSPYIYTLSLAVYASAWTYYGSVGVAAKSGLDFLPIYLGPVIAFPLWVYIMRKIIRISKQYKVSSIADFISLRYGKSRFIGALTTIILLIGIIPYISLQLKAIDETFHIIASKSNNNPSFILNDTTFYVAFLLAVFAAFYGTQKIDASEKHKGIVVSTAVESILKLIFFLIIGIYVTFYLFNGTTDIYNQMKQFPDFHKLITFNGLGNGFNWFYTILLSFFAIFLLPRQFQVSVIENNCEKDLKQAIWLFPLYLLLFNIFTIFIAWGGILTFGNTQNADYFTLLLTLHNGNTLLALMVFIGGFSAVVSMVILSTLALSTMVSNNLVIPYGFLNKFINEPSHKNTKYIKGIRRISIFLIIIASYLFYISFSIEVSLYSIGLVSFVIISQLAPAFFLGLYWNRGSSKGAIIGIISGFLVTFYTLILPFIIESFTGSRAFIEHGLFNIELLKPYALLGIDFFSPHIHAFFWSLTVNTFFYLVFSLALVSDYRERNYAEMIVDNSNFLGMEENAFVWKGEAYVADIMNVLTKFLGDENARTELQSFLKKYKLPNNTLVADARLIDFSEKLLSGSIGAASAKILIASVVKEERISLLEVLKILEESKETIARNKSLRDKSSELILLSKQLKDLNNKLIEQDKQKNEFLDTVAHELKTPVTGIRAAAELLIDEQDEMPTEIRSKFLNVILQDADRLSRLINNILDFEKLSSGRQNLIFEKNDFKTSLEKVLDSIKQIVKAKKIKIIKNQFSNILFEYDEDRIIQVLTNLLSNAIKFCDPQSGVILIDYKIKDQNMEFMIENNGHPIPKEDFKYIFDKFYQSSNQNIRKPSGSGLGLAISKQIIENHKGTIWAQEEIENGGRFFFQLPLKQTES